MRVSYQLSPAARRNVFIQTGTEPREIQVVEIDPAGLSPAEREVLYDLERADAYPKDERDRADRQLVRIEINEWSYGGATHFKKAATYDRILSPEELIEAAAALRTANAAVLDAVRAKNAERQAAEEERGRRAAEEKARLAEEHRVNFLADLSKLEQSSDEELIDRPFESPFSYRIPDDSSPEIVERHRLVRRRYDDLRQKARERVEAERREWIEAHGSDFLKKATASGYDCQRRYVIERAALELPGFIVDFDDRANWKSRACPSEAALDLEFSLREQGRRVEVVWLTEPASGRRADDFIDYDTDGEFEACEAVVVRGYLGKYDAIKEMP